MKQSFCLVILTLTLPIIAFAADAVPAAPTIEHTAPQTPDFTPPKDLNGAPFPIEDILGHPPAENNKFMEEFVKMIATLGIVIALILIVAWFLKRMVNAKLEQGNADSSIKVIERRAISQKTMVYLLDVGGKGIALAESHQGVTFLGNFPAPGLEGAEEPSAELPPPFAKILNNKDAS